MSHPLPLVTDRLCLRKPLIRDVPLLVQYAGNKAVSGNLLTMPHPYTEEDAVYWMNAVLQGWNNGERYVFAVVLKATDEFIGAVGLHPVAAHNHAEMGYWIAQPHWGQGYATEAVGAALRFGFEAIGLNRIYATHYTTNPGSEKVMLHQGMVKEGELAEHYKTDEGYKTIGQYRLLKQEWEAMQREARG